MATPNDLELRQYRRRRVLLPGRCAMREKLWRAAR
jgi:hypothetical protein